MCRLARPAIILVTALCALTLAEREALAQKQDGLVLALYAPTIPFKDTASQHTYLKLLADAIASNVGRRVEPRLYRSLVELRKAEPDLAIVEPQCATAGSPWQAIATARIGGRQSRRWALYGSRGQTVSSLRGRRLAVAWSGCKDKPFIENVLFASEVRLPYFGGTSPKTTVTGAVAEVASVRAAQAVLAPEAQGGALAKLFDAGEMPNPVLVVTNPRLASPLVDKIREAVVQFGSSGSIDGWGPTDRGALAALGRQLRGVPRRFVFAPPPPPKLRLKSLLRIAEDETASLSLRGYFAVDAGR